MQALSIEDGTIQIQYRAITLLVKSINDLLQLKIYNTEKSL